MVMEKNNWYVEECELTNVHEEGRIRWNVTKWGPMYKKNEKHKNMTQHTVQSAQ